MEEMLLQFQSVRPLPRAADGGGLRLRVRRHPAAHRASRSGRRLPARLNIAGERTGGVAGSSSGGAGRPVAVRWWCSARCRGMRGACAAVGMPRLGRALCHQSRNTRLRWCVGAGRDLVPFRCTRRPGTVPLSRRVQWSGWSVFRLKGLALALGRGVLVLPARGAFLV
ncbi:hypothetical protein TraAM80_06952 [Trypanosoma rangeli]|uniref:Uncharacterized protein n=1 Tax=Trypanosoma rangeli TaxID=5698 RepID=A0A422N7V0_TRYRA|nr:uncharacterized protein TraAM80_06952 [Trypanosoma rangeli]RNF01525.1 hypothetical protein TraAM80_06952 [Trypanosoma rangeli]|eukprot:RNF01525.1 hypothetical protein TraAM80_06952 [Trypanosoma rangeli]